MFTRVPRPRFKGFHMSKNKMCPLKREMERERERCAEGQGTGEYHEISGLFLLA